MRILVIDSGASLRSVVGDVQDIPGAEVEQVDTACLRTIDDVRMALGVHFDLALVHTALGFHYPPPEMEVAYETWGRNVRRLRQRAKEQPFSSSVDVFRLIQYLRTEMHASVMGYVSSYSLKELDAMFGDLLSERTLRAGIVMAVCHTFGCRVPPKHIPPFPKSTLKPEPSLSLFTGLDRTVSETQERLEHFRALREAGRHPRVIHL